MRTLFAVFALAASSEFAYSQESFAAIADPAPVAAECSLEGFVECQSQARSPLQSNRNFPDFIGFMTNPGQAIDPRSLTQFWPVFLHSSWNPNSALPGGSAEVYGAGINLALTERFSVGLNQGGAAVIHYNPVQVPLPSLQQRTDEFRGTHSGWLNLGGFAQYTLVENVPDQFLFTVGARLEVPTGEASVYQGHGQPILSPYFTTGKGWGNFHLLNTIGYAFSLGEGRDTISSFYGNLHFDYKLGRFYPLLEFNWAAYTRNFKTDLPFDRGLVNFSSFTATGSYLTVSPGVNTILVQDRLEFGAAYTTKLAAQRNFDLNGLIVKMIMRY